jgi:hypothetical protein
MGRADEEWYWWGKERRGGRLEGLVGDVVY